jgi:hypothetical protein
MHTKKVRSGNSPQEPTIEELKRRYEDLRDKKVEAEANKKNSERQLEELKKQARDRYGTDELGKLQNMLHAMKDENKRRLTEYERHLDEIESGLEEVSADHKAAMNEDQAS